MQKRISLPGEWPVAQCSIVRGQDKPGHCGYCGKENEAAADFCGGCGTMLRPAQDPISMPPMSLPTDRRFFAMAAWVGLLVPFAAAVAVCFIMPTVDADREQARFCLNL